MKHLAIMFCSGMLFGTISNAISEIRAYREYKERHARNDEEFVSFEDRVRDKAKKAFSLQGMPKTIRCYVKVPEDDPSYRIGEHPYWFITITNDYSVSDKVKETTK